MYRLLLTLILLLQCTDSLIPPKFQWKQMDYAWKHQDRGVAMANGDYIPENNMPLGLARWRDKIFVTVPRWKQGVPSSLNYIYINGTQDQPLNPYPNWNEAFLAHGACCVSHNSTVVSAFRVAVDRSDRLWVVDNGVMDMYGNRLVRNKQHNLGEAKPIAKPAILIFDLKTDRLIHKHIFRDYVYRDSSMFTNIVVDLPGKGKECGRTYAYVADTGSNAIIVYNLEDNIAWRVENQFFHFDPHAGQYLVGGIEFYWSRGVSGLALGQRQGDGTKDLYFHPTSSTKLFKINTRYLRSPNVPQCELFNAIEIVGERGPRTQATACDFDPFTNILFYTQINKNGIACWNSERPFDEINTPLIFSDCNLLEFPNDVKVDQEGNVWMLSNRQSRFLYGKMNFNQVNYRILTASIKPFVQGTACEPPSILDRALSYIRPRSARSCCSN